MNENEKLLKVLTMLALLVYEIEDLTSTGDLVREEKMLANRLKDLILKNHKKRFDLIWKVEEGEETHMMLYELYEQLLKKLATMKIDRLPIFLEMASGIEDGTIEVVDK